MRLPVIAVALVALMAAGAAKALDPEEQLTDPALESRARALAQQLRCPVCQGETVDDSDAGVARDLRGLLRARLQAGDSDTEALNAVAARFGESALLRPDARGANLVLWLAGPTLFGMALLGVVLGRRRPDPSEPPLSPAESARLTGLPRSPAPHAPDPLQPDARRSSQ